MQRPVTIAIAEDHDKFREVLRLSLNNAGFHVVASAPNGRDLLQQLVHLAEPPQLCITDLHMPLLDGYELVPLLKRTYPFIRIAVYSTSDDYYTQQEMKQRGADVFISKADTVEHFLAVLQSLK
ncbi:MAG TPA: response regulator [Chitinophagaceae bacterium]